MTLQALHAPAVVAVTNKPKVYPFLLKLVEMRNMLSGRKKFHGVISCVDRRIVSSRRAGDLVLFFAGRNYSLQCELTSVSVFASVGLAFAALPFRDFVPQFESAETALQYYCSLSQKGMPLDRLTTAAVLSWDEAIVSDPKIMFFVWSVRTLQAHLPTQRHPLKIPKKNKFTLESSSDDEIDEPGTAEIRSAPVSGDVLQCLVDQVSKSDAGMSDMERKFEKLDTKFTALEKDIVLMKKARSRQLHLLHPKRRPLNCRR